MDIIITGIIIFAAYKLGLIRGAVSIYKKSDAGAAIKSLLSLQKDSAWFAIEPNVIEEISSKYVTAAWEAKPDVFNGKFGKRPHRVAAAIYALALAVKGMAAENNQDADSVIMAFTRGITDIEKDGAYLPFTSLDQALIQEAIEIAMPVMDSRPNVVGL